MRHLSSVILFGFKGSGKTYLGKHLSIALQRVFIDTDELIIRLYGDPKLAIKTVYQNLGASSFRALEKKAVFSISPLQQSIIALGGGTVLDPENVAYLQSIGQLIYLKATFPLLQQRILTNTIPAFADVEKSIESLYKIYQKRLPIYESIQAASIDLDLLDEMSYIPALLKIVKKYSHGI